MRILSTILICFTTLTAAAQVEKQQTFDSQTTHEVESSDERPVPITPLSDNVSHAASPTDSIPLTVRLPYDITGHNTLFTSWMMSSPFAWGMPWNLHEGFNAQLDLGVMVGFGRNNPFRGGSFFYNISLAYAKPLSPRWTVALGGTLSRFRFFNENTFAENAFLLANYQFNEHWDTTIYTSYNHMPEGMSMFTWGAPFEQSIRIGGELTYKLKKTSFSIGISHDIPVGNDRPWIPRQHTNPQGQK